MHSFIIPTAGSQHGKQSVMQRKKNGCIGISELSYWASFHLVVKQIFLKFAKKKGGAFPSSH